MQARSPGQVPDKVARPWAGHRKKPEKIGHFRKNVISLSFSSCGSWGRDVNTASPKTTRRGNAARRGRGGMKVAAYIWMHGDGYAESFSVLFVLCHCSLTLMELKGYAGGLVVSTANGLHIGLLGVLLR
jgi:hypothetical protein